MVKLLYKGFLKGQETNHLNVWKGRQFTPKSPETFLSNTRNVYTYTLVKKWQKQQQQQKPINIDKSTEDEEI